MLKRRPTDIDREVTIPIGLALAAIAAAAAVGYFAAALQVGAFP